MGNYFVPLTRNAIGAASKTQNSQRQMALLDQCKTVAESALQLLYAAKEGGGNPKVRPRKKSCAVISNRPYSAIYKKQILVGKTPNVVHIGCF